MIEAELNEDFIDMLAALADAGAEFVVVGAHGLAAHGIVRHARCRRARGRRFDMITQPTST